MKKKATAGERLIAALNRATITEIRRNPLHVIDSLMTDRLLARERAKVAEDVLEMADDVAQTRDELVAKVRAKYGKGKR